MCNHTGDTTDDPAASLLQKCQVSCACDCCTNGNPLFKKDCSHLSELQVIVWSFVGAVVFVCSWWYTGGGYYCSLPIFALCFFYCYKYDCSSRKLEVASSKYTRLARQLTGNIRKNMKFLLREDKRSMFLILSYLIVKGFLVVAYPAAESSNGSPLSLILFTAIFICIYLIPPIFTTIFFSVKALCRVCSHWGENHSTSSYGILEKMVLCFRHVLKWKRSLLVVSVIVMSTYLLDGELSAMIRFMGVGKPCWPILGHQKALDTEKMPSNMINTILWQRKFKDYKPHSVLRLIISYGRELGEVCHLLPLLISTYTLAQLLLPPKNSLIKKALFASIAGVVLGGVTSGMFKILFHRYRPNAYGNPYMWTGPGMTTVDHMNFSKLDLSFPAGHTTVTTAVATCIYVFTSSNLNRVKLSRLAWILLLLCIYTHPILVLVSRVSDCYHWMSDASFGVCKTNICHLYFAALQKSYIYNLTDIV